MGNSSNNISVEEKAVTADIAAQERSINLLSNPIIVPLLMTCVGHVTVWDPGHAH